MQVAPKSIILAKRPNRGPSTIIFTRGVVDISKEGEGEAKEQTAGKGKGNRICREEAFDHGL
jgi:hypothetical protein